MGRLIDADELLKAMNTWDKFGLDSHGYMRRITKDKNTDLVPYVHYDDMLKAVNGTPTVEAYTKDVVIAMLIQILDEISNKTAITKDSKDKIACALADGWNNSQLRDCEIIRTKIAELRGQTNGKID